MSERFSGQRVLMVGAGLGALRTAEALRANGFAGSIVIVGDEPHHPYNRPPLSKEFLSGAVDAAALTFRRRSLLDDVEWRLGTAVSRVDLASRSAILGDGEVLTFDAVVLATGVAARRLAVPGPPAEASAGRHVIRTLDGVRRLKPELARGARVVVVGAGFIGCEVAATAVRLGCQVTCVEVDELPMARPLGRVLASYLRDLHIARGVRFRFGVSVVELHGTDRVTAVRLSDGTCVAADLVIEAVGSRPRTEVVADQGLDTSDGVLCDSSLRPIGPHGPVTAAVVVGDLARFPYPRFGDEPRRVEHWNIPTETGRRAGAVLARYLGCAAPKHMVAGSLVPSFWSEQYGLRLQSYGLPALGHPDETRLLAGGLDDGGVMGYHRDGVLVGVVGLGSREVHTYRESLAADK